MPTGRHSGSRRAAGSDRAAGSGACPSPRRAAAAAPPCRARGHGYSCPFGKGHRLGWTAAAAAAAVERGVRVAAAAVPFHRVVRPRRRVVGDAHLRAAHRIVDEVCKSLRAVVVVVRRRRRVLRVRRLTRTGSALALGGHRNRARGRRQAGAVFLLAVVQEPAIKTVWRWSALYCRGAPVGSEAPGGRALGDVDRLLSRRRDVRLWSRLARCEVPFGM